MESAGVTLVKGDLGLLVSAILLGRATMRNIRQNLVFAFVYNILGVPIAAGVLYPMFGLLLNPMLASLAMSLSSVSVIANALRLRTFRPTPSRYLHDEHLLPRRHRSLFPQRFRSRIPLKFRARFL